MLGGEGEPTTEVRAQDNGQLARALERRGHGIERDGGSLLVAGATPEEVGVIAATEQVTLAHLAPRQRSLEAAFLALTGGER